MNETLISIGKVTLDLSEGDMSIVDAFVRDNTIDRFGPVRAVSATPESRLVCEIAFRGLTTSKRRKSGYALRAPRVVRLHQDNPHRPPSGIEALQAAMNVTCFLPGSEPM